MTDKTEIRNGADITIRLKYAAVYGLIGLIVGGGGIGGITMLPGTAKNEAIQEVKSDVYDLRKEHIKDVGTLKETIHNMDKQMVEINYGVRNVNEKMELLLKRNN